MTCIHARQRIQKFSLKNNQWPKEDSHKRSMK
jgi:hypothetical protein